MSRGTIMEFPDEHTAIVLSSDLHFIRVQRRPDMSIGSELDLYSSEHVASRKQDSLQARVGRMTTRRRLIWRASGAVAAMAFAVVAFSWFQIIPARAMPYAYVSVDVNPSVQFAVNKNEAVIAVTPLDSDGARVVKALRVNGENITSAVRDYLRQLEHDGYLRTQSSVIVTTSGARQVSSRELSPLVGKVKKAVQTTVSGRPVSVTALVVQRAVMKTALAYHVSPGRLALYVEAKREGAHVSWKTLLSGRMAAAVGGETQLSALVQQLGGDHSLGVALNTLATTASETPGKDIDQVLAKGGLVNQLHPTVTVKPRPGRGHSSRHLSGHPAGQTSHEKRHRRAHPTGQTGLGKRHRRPHPGGRMRSGGALNVSAQAQGSQLSHVPGHAAQNLGKKQRRPRHHTRTKPHLHVGIGSSRQVIHGGSVTKQQTGGGAGLRPHWKNRRLRAGQSKKGHTGGIFDARMHGGNYRSSTTGGVASRQIHPQRQKKHHKRRHRADSGGVFQRGMHRGRDRV